MDIRVDYPMDTREHARRSLAVLDHRVCSGCVDGETAVTVRERIFSRWPDLRLDVDHAAVFGERADRDAVTVVGEFRITPARFAVRDNVEVVIKDLRSYTTRDVNGTEITRDVPHDWRRAGHVVEQYPGDPHRYLVEHADGEVPIRILYPEDRLRHADVEHAKALWQDIEERSILGEPVIVTQRMLAILGDNGYQIHTPEFLRALESGAIILADEERDPTDAERTALRVVRERGMREYRTGVERAMRQAIGLDHLLPRDILNAIVFGGAPDPKRAQRVALGSETMNSVAQIFGLRNGMVSAFDLPPRLAHLVQQIDHAIERFEVRFMPQMRAGEAWGNRYAPKGTPCHD